MKEIWKDIKGYEGLYQISNLGRVKSLPRAYRCVFSTKEIIMKPSTNIAGYLQINLNSEGNLKNYKIHRLVAEAFIPNPENKPQVNHIDEDKTNNLASNLEWVTAKENNNHGTRNCRISKSVACSNGIIYSSITEAAQSLGLHTGHISKVCKGIRKSTCGYTFKYINEGDNK